MGFRRFEQGQPTMEGACSGIRTDEILGPALAIGSCRTRGGRDLQQRIRDYANNRMATIPTYLIGSDCGMYIIGTDKSCELSGNGQIVFTNPTNSCVGAIVWKR